MKIVITTDPLIPVPPLLYGGIERIVDMLVKGLVKQGHQVTLFAHPDSNVNCRLVPYPSTSQRPGAVLRNTLTISRILASRCDVVHSFGRLAYLTALLPTRIPKIMSYQREPSAGQVRKAVRLARKGSLVFTGCSEYIAQQIRPFAPSYAIHNGVPVNAYTFRDQVAADAPLVFLGRIEPIKGAHVAIEVARRSGRKLVIAGNVPVEAAQYFSEQIEPHVDGQQIQYVGPVNDEQKNKLLGEAAAFLMPILWDEPFGIVMAEALACGTPVIGLNRGAVPEVVQDGLNGFQCSTTDDMVTAVSRLNRLSRYDARRTMEEKFSDKTIVEAYLKLYHQVIN